MKKFFVFMALAFSVFLTGNSYAQYNPFNPDFAWCNIQGSVATRQANGWGCLQPGAAGQVLQSGGPGANTQWLTVTGTGTVTSVSGSGGTTGMSLSGGPITTVGTLTLGGTLDETAGGTGLTSYAAGDILYASGANTLAKLPIGGTGTVLKSNGTAPIWSSVIVPSFSAGSTGFTPNSTTSGAITLAGTLDADNGGTGISSYTAGDILYANSSTTLTKLPVGGTGQVMWVGAGGTPEWTSAIAIANSITAGDGIAVNTVGTDLEISADLSVGDGLTITPGNPTNISLDTGALPGVANNSVAAAGDVGEIISGLGSGGLTTGVLTALGSISLTPGTWDITASMAYRSGGALTAQQFTLCVGPTVVLCFDPATGYTAGMTGVQVPADGDFVYAGDTFPASLASMPLRVNLSSTTTYYAIARANFTAGSVAGYGRIRATRVR